MQVFNSNLQEQLLLDYNQESKLKLQECNKLIANKKSLMTIILKQCNVTTITKKFLGVSCEDYLEAREFIKVLIRIRTVCNRSNNGSLLFGSRVAKIAKHNIWPLQFIEALLVTYPTNDAIWDHTDPCNVSIDTVDNVEIITSSHIIEELVYTYRKSNSHELLQVIVSMS